MTENHDERYKLLLEGITCVANRSLKAGDAQLIRWAAERDMYLYIGRENGRHKLERSIWHNPFRGVLAIPQFKEYLANKPELLDRIPELKGKLLVCWCHPAPCHGHHLAELANQEGENS